MAIYTLLLLRDGGPVRKIKIECRDDLDALDAARPLARDRVVEVRTETRLVARVNIDDAPPDFRDNHMNAQGRSR